jgi:hypothetical protein
MREIVQSCTVQYSEKHLPWVAVWVLGYNDVSNLALPGRKWLKNWHFVFDKKSANMIKNNFVKNAI